MALLSSATAAEAARHAEKLPSLCVQYSFSHENDGYTYLMFHIGNATTNPVLLDIPAGNDISCDFRVEKRELHEQDNPEDLPPDVRSIPVWRNLHPQHRFILLHPGPKCSVEFLYCRHQSYSGRKQLCKTAEIAAYDGFAITKAEFQLKTLSLKKAAEAKSISDIESALEEHVVQGASVANGVVDRAPVLRIIRGTKNDKVPDRPCGGEKGAHK